ncbi:hypothetical protein BVRB_4g088170 [Beta vulgaris subsp. vulgaris]|nr:hypothetical protein BVRB_4g088170 [Beta vulgaris subsp. vulgaris]
MGRIREFTDKEETTAASTASISEALLFTTMYIVGLPVEVHIKDGSIFSGIFHTASFDKGYGIVLKKARMIKKGTHNTNVSDSGLIDTLVVLAGDLVQVVAKGVMLSADNVSNPAACEFEGTVSGTIDSCRSSENEALSTAERRNEERQVGVPMLQEDEDHYRHHSEVSKEVSKVNGSSRSLIDNNKLNVQKENYEMRAFNHLGDGSLPASDASLDLKHMNQLLDKESTSTESVASEHSDSAKTDLDATHNPSAVPTERAPQNPLPSRTAKESKLNPSAKVFSPSFPNYRSTPPPVATVPSVAYVSNNFPAVQVAGAQPELIRPIAPRSSWPVKFVSYVSSTAMNADNGLQYNQPIAGHYVTRAQPIRHGAQYQSIQAMPTYVHPNPQNGIYGRPGQLVYVHPVTHDVIQAPAALSQAPHALLTSHPIHVGIAKNEGAGVLAGPTLPVPVTPPLMGNGPQSYTMPSHIHQLSTPHFSSIRHVPVLGPSMPYSAKFQ